MEHLKFGPSVSILGRKDVTEVIICLLLIVVLVYFAKKK